MAARTMSSVYPAAAGPGIFATFDDVTGVVSSVRVLNQTGISAWCSVIDRTTGQNLLSLAGVSVDVNGGHTILGNEGDHTFTTGLPTIPNLGTTDDFGVTLRWPA
jgi:hypothetical protein